MPTRRGMMAGGAALATLSGARVTAQPAPEIAWTPRAPLPLRVQEVYAAAHEGRVWLAGGLSPDVGEEGLIGVSDRVLTYDPSSDEWTDGPSLPQPRHHPHLVSHEGRLYAVGGFTVAEGGIWHATRSVLVLDGERWREAAPLPYPQAETVCASVGDRLHVVTGRRPAGAANAQWSDHADTNAHLAYDAEADAWEVRTPAPTARNSAAGAVIGNALLVVGGRTVSGGNSPAFEAYDAEADAWTRLPDMPQTGPGPAGRGGLAAGVLDRTLVVMGGEWFGEDGGGVYADTLAFDLGERRWRTLAPMPVPRHGLGLAVLDGTAYAVGGAARPSGNETTALNTALRLS